MTDHHDPADRPDEADDLRPDTSVASTAGADATTGGAAPETAVAATDGAYARGPEASARRFSTRQLSPWWRLGAAAVAVGALVWGASAGDGVWRLGGDGSTPGQTGAPTAPPAEAGAFVEAARLGCPGPEPLNVDGASPTTEVVAAAAPESVLDAVPPTLALDRGDAAASTADAADDATTTSAPDDAVTSAPDDAAATSTTDDAAGTSAPDDAVSTSAPDGAAVTTSPAGPSDGASVLRTTEGPEPARELLRGAPVSLPLDGPVSALVVAHDELAAGVAAGQLSVGTEQGARGVTLAGCTSPVESHWLVGGGDQPGRAEQLVLTNPGPDAVTVDVAVLGSDGPVSTTGGSGIVVPGNGRTVELLDAIAPGAAAPVVHVVASGGPVVAHLAETYRDGTTDRGAEIVSTGAAPAADLVVPALPTMLDERAHEVVLRIAAPGEVEAVVDLTALTEGGAVRLAERVTRVPAGSTVDVPLDSLPEGATALRLRSDEPVVAGAWLDVLPAEGEPTAVPVEPDETDDAGTQSSDGATEEPSASDQDEPLRRPAGESAWVSSAVPSTGPVGMAVPARGAVPDATTELALTAVDGTTAWVTWVDAAGTRTAHWVDLPNDTTVVVPVPDDARAVWVVGAGPAGVVASLHVGGQDETGPYVASATLPRLPWQRQLTDVRPVVP